MESSQVDTHSQLPSRHARGSTRLDVSVPFGDRLVVAATVRAARTLFPSIVNSGPPRLGKSITTTFWAIPVKDMTKMESRTPYVLS